MNNHAVHLNEDQLIRAIVDENDLTVSERNHLRECALCMKEKRATEKLLHRLGDLSREVVSSPERRIIAADKGRRSSLRWSYALVAGCAVVLLVMGIWWGSFTTRFQGNGSTQVAQKMVSDQLLMEEIVFAEDNALPDRYLVIVGHYGDDEYDDSSDDYYYDGDDYYDPYDDDQFLEFVFPL